MEKYFFDLTSEEKEQAIRRNFVFLLKEFGLWHNNNFISLNLGIENLSFKLTEQNQWEATIDNSSVEPQDFYRNWAKFEKNPEKKEYLLSFAVWEKNAYLKLFLRRYMPIERIKGTNKFVYKRGESIIPFEKDYEEIYAHGYQNRIKNVENHFSTVKNEEKLNELKLLRLFGNSIQIHEFSESEARKIAFEEEKSQLSFFTEFLNEKIELMKLELSKLICNEIILEKLRTVLKNNNSISFDSNSLIIFDCWDENNHFGL